MQLQDATDASASSAGRQDHAFTRYQLRDWGWAKGLDKLQVAAAKLGISPAAGLAAHQFQQADAGIPDFQQLIASSSEARAPHCAAKLLQDLRMTTYHDSLGMSAVCGAPNEAWLQSLRTAVREHVDDAWATEAVRQGVNLAKAGNYEEAMHYYNKALELQPSHVDAMIARGAALANQHKFKEAADDLSQALQLDPGNHNAQRYLAVVQQRLAEQQQRAQQQQHVLRHAAASVGVRPPSDGQHRQHQQQQDERTGHFGHHGQPPHQQQPQHGAETSGKRSRMEARDKSGSASSGTSSDSKSSGTTSEAEDGQNEGQASAIKTALQAVLKARRKEKHKSKEKRSRSKGKHKKSRSKKEGRSKDRKSKKRRQ